VRENLFVGVPNTGTESIAARAAQMRLEEITIGHLREKLGLSQSELEERLERLPLFTSGNKGARRYHRRQNHYSSILCVSFVCFSDRNYAAYVEAFGML
jgi:hypothetical protein